jgi:hypothetical protein
MKCETCKWWDPVPDVSDYGQCQLPNPDPQFFGWIMQRDDGCCEHQQKPEDAP